MTAPTRPAAGSPTRPGGESSARPAAGAPGPCGRCGAPLRSEDVRPRRHPAATWVVVAGALVGVAFLFVPSPLPFAFDGTRGTVSHAAIRVALPAFLAGSIASLLPRRRTCRCRACGTVSTLRSAD